MVPSTQPSDGARDPARRRARSIAIVLPFGNDHASFFGDTIEARMCEEARLLGHRAELVRVYYDGDGAERDAEIGRRLLAWLEAEAIDVVVAERVFDPAPLVAHRARDRRRRLLFLAHGESPSALEGVDFTLFDDTSRPRLAREELAPAEHLLDVFAQTIEALAYDEDPGALPGVSRVVDGKAQRAAPIVAASRRRPFRATVAQVTIALEPPAPTRRRTLYGTYGCPYAGDPTTNEHYRGVSLPVDRPISRLGCAFCHMGGDYVAGTDEAIVASLVEQARFWVEADPSIDELVMADQHPIRYLAALMRATATLRPLRWLFAARADAFVRERARLEEALLAAEAAGHRLEVYLTGFESFSDVELRRYNKGVTVADQLAAVDAMRELHARHPRAFDYAKVRGHSLITWNPWTQPADLRATVETVRRHGLRELFHELGRNRLRLHPNLPIFHAALRDGAVSEGWDEAGEGAARGKGYGVEQPWRFLDPRTRLASGLARALRERLGIETELAQLTAIAELVASEEASPDAEAQQVERILRGVERVQGALAPLLRDRGGEGPRRVASRGAAVVRFAGACNNGCAGCSNRDTWLDDRREALEARIALARREGKAIVLAGREPTLHPDFLALLVAARGDDERTVGIVTNARRFANARFTHAAVRAGLSVASVKLFGADAASADAYVRVGGAHAQALEGLASLGGARVVLEARAVLHRGVLADLPALAELAAKAGATRLRLDVPLDAIGLARLDEAADAIERLSGRCVELGLPLAAGPIGHPGFEELVVAAPRVSEGARASSVVRS